MRTAAGAGRGMSLERQPEGSLEGRIAYIGHAMTKTQSGASYGYFGKARFQGPSIAASKGAVGCLIRSIGTHSHRLPHTGGTGWGDISPCALGAEQTEQTECGKITKHERNMQVYLFQTSR